MRFNVQLEDQTLFTIYIDPPCYGGRDDDDHQEWVEEILIPAVKEQGYDPDTIDDYWSSTY